MPNNILGSEGEGVNTPFVGLENTYYIKSGALDKDETYSTSKVIPKGIALGTDGTHYLVYDPDAHDGHETFAGFLFEGVIIKTDVNGDTYDVDIAVCKGGVVDPSLVDNWDADIETSDLWTQNFTDASL